MLFTLFLQLGGISPKCCFFAAKRWFNRIISFTFLCNSETLHSLHNSMFGDFLGDFWVYLKGDSFSQRIG